MKYEIDQSGRIEETNRPTIIAIANKDFNYSIKINAKIKRQILIKFKKHGKPKMFAIYGFASGLIILLIKSKIKSGIIIIDLEYPGYNQIILREMHKVFQNKFEYRFTRIGKKSYAHTSALKVFKRKINANFDVKREGIEKLMIQMIVR